MKQYLLFLFIMLFPLLAVAQTPAINDFYRSHKKDNGTFNMALPGWLIHMGAGVGRAFVEEQEVKVGLRFAKKIKKLKLLISEEQSSITTGQYLQLVSEVKSNDYEELITVQEGATRVNILVREKKEKIRGLLVLVREEDSFVMVSMKTKFKMEDVNKLLKDVLREKYLKKKKEEPPITKPTKPRPPQA